jgi:aspartate/tyrosine/aromatic aminotransferase
MDPTMEQWKEISDTVKKQKLVPFFDCAYQVSRIMAGKGCNNSVDFMLLEVVS